MTVNSVDITDGPYIGNGIAQLFDYSFVVQRAEDLRVYETDLAGNQSLLVLDVDYTVGNIGTSNGQIFRVDGPLPTGWQLFIRSNFEATQLTSFNSQGAFFPDLHEKAVDKLTYLIQQTDDKINRSLRYPDSYAEGSTGATLPIPESQKLLRWKSDLTGLENISVSEINPAFVVLTDYTKKVDSWAAVANFQAVDGEIFYLKGHTPIMGATNPYRGGGWFQIRTGSVTNDNGTQRNIATANRYAQRLEIAITTPYMFGAYGDGVNNDCDPFRYNIAASKNIYLPGNSTFLIAPTAASGDFMLYLGIANGQANRSGMTIFGDGRSSVIKLANNVGASKLLFGLASNDVLSDVTFKDFCFDLNAANNLQVNFGDPLRLNSAFYGFGKCSNFLFQNLYIKNISGHQAFRIGADDVNKYGDNIRFINCDFENFGIAISGNNQQDVSVVYCQADRIHIEGCTFKNPNFTFQLNRGHTCLELHGDSSTIVTGNTFTYAQLPVLIVSSAKANRNVVISKNIFNECNYLFSLDGAELAQRNITIVDNIYTSSKVESVICPLGNSSEVTKDREQVVFKNNTLMGFGNTNQDTPVFNIEDSWCRSLEIVGNTVGGFNGSLLRVAGSIKNTGAMTVTVKNNSLDSLGSTAGVSPNDPCFIDISHSSGSIANVTVQNNTLYNSSGKNYSAVGCYRVNGAVLNTDISGTTGTVNKDYPVVTGVITSAVTKVIESNSQEIPVKHRSPVVALAGNSSVNLYDFSTFGNNDNALLEIKIYANIGGTGSGTVQSYDVLYSSNGKIVLKQTGAGTYNTDLIVELSGTALRVRSTTATALSFNYVVNGDSTKNIIWLV